MTALTLYRQIHPEQCPTLKTLGFQTLINLRQEGEQPDQPCGQRLASSAKAAGLTYHHLPIDGECVLDSETVARFAKLLTDSPKPIMVFCATGGRAKRLYQSAKISGLV